jgi:hypothetical protein
VRRIDVGDADFRLQCGHGRAQLRPMTPEEFIAGMLR